MDKYPHESNFTESLRLVAAGFVSAVAVGGLVAQNRERHRLHEKLASRETDAMTGLLSCDVFMEKSTQMLEGLTKGRRADDRQGEIVLCLAFGDVKGLHDINKAFGFVEGGNKIITAGAEVMQQVAGMFREEDLVGRIGGDEFAALLRIDTTHFEDETWRTLVPELVTERTEHLVARHNHAVADGPQLGLRVGFSFAMPGQAVDILTLIKQADPKGPEGRVRAQEVSVADMTRTQRLIIGARFAMGRLPNDTRYNT